MSTWLSSLRRAAGKMGLLFLALALLVLVVRFVPDLDEHALAHSIRDKGAWGILLFMGMTAVLSALGAPRQALSFVGGYAFGAALGLLYATIGTTLGCAGSFFLVRRFGRPYLPARFTRRMEALDAFIAASPFSMTLTVRCMPFGNNALTNVLAGMSSIPPARFIAGSCVGYLPQNFIFALLGSGVRVDAFWRVVLSAALFLLALSIGVMLYRKHRAALSPAEKSIEL